VTALSIGLFFLIRLNVRVSALELIFLLVLVIGGGVVILFLTTKVMTSVYKNANLLSENTHLHLKALNKNEYMQYTRVLKSLPPICCQVGKFYFMEKMAELIILDIVVQFVVYLLLTI